MSLKTLIVITLNSIKKPKIELGLNIEKRGYVWSKRPISCLKFSAPDPKKTVEAKIITVWSPIKVINLTHKREPLHIILLRQEKQNF